MTISCFLFFHVKNGNEVQYVWCDYENEGSQLIKSKIGYCNVIKQV